MESPFEGDGVEVVRPAHVREGSTRRVVADHLDRKVQQAITYGTTASVISANDTQTRSTDQLLSD